jgi:hypothetical protein
MSSSNLLSGSTPLAARRGCAVLKNRLIMFFHRKCKKRKFCLCTIQNVLAQNKTFWYRMFLPGSVATLPPFSSIEVQKWFDQISSQWESQKNRFALTYFGKIQFLPPCIWNLPFMSTATVLACNILPVCQYLSARCVCYVTLLLTPGGLNLCQIVKNNDKRETFCRTEQFGKIFLFIYKCSCSPKLDLLPQGKR